MNTMTIKRTLMPLAVAAALLSGCNTAADGEGGGPGPAAPTDNGVAALAPDEILARAKTALKGAKSYRIKGDIDSDGQKMSLDLRVSGADVAGTLSMGGATVELLSVGGQQYMRPDEAFWTMTAGAQAAGNIVKLMGDKWAKVSAKEQDFSALFSIANVDELLKPEGTVTKGEPKKVNGVDAIGLIDGSADGGTLYIATTGEPYPVALEGKDPAEGQVMFSDFGATFDDLKAPAESEVIDFDQLTNG